MRRGYRPIHSNEAFLNTCRGKVPHTSKKQALGRLRVMQQDPATTAPHTLQVYRCAVCHHWHLGRSRFA